MNNLRNPFTLGLLVLTLGIFFFSVGAIWRVSEEVLEPVELPEVPYVQSTTCQRCHPDHYQTWYRTFHRTMTQLADESSVVGDFENAKYSYQGVNSRFFRQGDVFYIETQGFDGQMQDFEIVMTVGSRRFQQYVTRINDRNIRLPLAWNIEEGAWFHLNGGFLHPDDTDFNTHASLWDGNCIFCHNVKAQPGYDLAENTYDSQVVEMGIACEACHGPGAEHISRNTNPIRRYFLYYGDRDPTIISPLELSKEKQVQICGHCHGQRLPAPLERIEEFMAIGDPYTVGDDLNQYTNPLWQDTEFEGFDISLRFWKDGTPRLTAYEYQALLQTVDYQQGDLTCTSCHNMHGGDPKGMLDEAMHGPQACLQCHAEIGEDTAEHTKHDPASTGSDCYACHMPKITYGLLRTHPTHRIQNPDPARAWRHDMPEACTLCHTNETAIWAARALSDQYSTPLPNDLPDDAQFDMTESVRSLLGGDVVQRAVAAMALSDEKSYLDDPSARLWAVPFLLVTMEDEYPAVRLLAFRSLETLIGRAADADLDLSLTVANLPDFDALSEPKERDEIIAIWKSWWGNVDKESIPHPGEAVPLDENLLPIRALIDPLVAAQDTKIITIGE